MEIFDTYKLQALPLLSIVRSTITAHAGTILPLPGLELDEFLSTRWDDLPLQNTLRVQAGLALARLFPAAWEKKGEGEEALLANELSNCASPQQTVDLIGRLWRNGGGQVVFMSSGSTGKPKAAPHSQAMLLQELEALIPLFPKLSQVITLTPLQHCYGFMFGVLLPLALNLPSFALPPLPPVVRGAIIPETLLVGFPDFWRNMPSADYTPSKGVLCLSATAPWPLDAQRALRKSGYNQSIEIFGSSENGVIGWRNDPDESFALLPYWSRNLEDSKSLLRTLPDGEQKLLPLQDEFKWDGNKKFYPAGRADNAVQVGGINVYPARIANIISALPGVAECRVRFMRPEEGWRLKAFIVPEKGWNAADLTVSLKAYFHEQLSPPERPAQLNFGSEIPKTDYGKDSDW